MDRGSCRTSSEDKEDEADECRYIKVTCELPSTVSARSFMKLRLNTSLRDLHCCRSIVMVLMAHQTLHCVVLVYLFEIAFNLIAVSVPLQPSAGLCFLSTWSSSCWHLKMYIYGYCSPPVFHFISFLHFLFVFSFCFFFASLLFKIIYAVSVQEV